MTRAFYDAHAAAFCDRTEGLDVEHLHAPFLALVPPGGHILDAGCGSGRDARAFLARGHRVTATDASPAMVAEASRRLGFGVRVERLEDLAEREQYDGIWACASLLHVPAASLDDVLGRLAAALRPGGVLYASFKRGTGERVDGEGRHFHDLTGPSLEVRLAAVPHLAVVTLWETEDARPDRPNERWVNGLARRV